MKTEHHLPAIAVYVIGIVVIVGLIFLSVIKDIYVLLITASVIYLLRSFLDFLVFL